MPESNTPYDPEPERQDALGELARDGYLGVPGDHAARLRSLQNRLGLPAESSPSADAVVRSLRQRRWLAIAAGIAVLLVAGIAVFTYDSPQQQIAKVTAPVSKVEIQHVQEATPRVSAADTPPLESIPSASRAESNVRKRKSGERTATVPEVRDEIVAEDAIPVENRSAAKTGLGTASQPLAAPRSPSKSEAFNSEPAVIAEPEKADTPQNAHSETLIVESANEEDMTTAAGEVAEDEVSRFRMERVPPVKTREVTGEVFEPSGVPVVGAMLTVEETGQQVLTDQKGEFTILLTDEAIVGNISRDGFNELLFDLTAGEEFRLFLPRISSSLPTAQLKGKSVSLRLIAPKAAAFDAFDAHVAAKRSIFSGEEVTVQFDVNRFGRPRQIVTGPGPQNRDAVKMVKDWLKNGPDWPEEYQRKTWRYTVLMP